MKKCVEVTWKAPGMHCWPEAPEEVDFLRNPHRHLFWFTAWATITKSRQIEFFLLRNQMQVLTAKIADYNFLGYDFKDFSCEQIAEKLLKHAPPSVYAIKVSEDNENASIVQKEDRE